MAVSLLGYWSGGTSITVTSLSNSEERAVSSRKSITPEPSTVFDGTAGRSLRSVSENNRSDEVYHDAPENPVAVPQKKPCAPGSSNISRFEPEITDSNDMEDVEWRKFQPPKELFDVPYGTPLEIESIIIASVERLQQQLAEELSFRENAAFVLAREQSKEEQEIPVLEAPPETGGGELLIVSNGGRVLKLAHF